MTEVPIEVGYRSYITLLRKKWDIVYHSKDLYFSHANKTLEPFYDMHTKEFYGIETNPTRLAIVTFINQFRDGPGIYDPTNFTDLQKDSINYAQREKVRKPFRSNRHQSSHPSLLDALREHHYLYLERKPVVKEVLPRKHPYQYSLFVEDHPYNAMVGRRWTHIFVPNPPDFEVLDDPERNTGYRQWLLEACSDANDMIVVEPIRCQFYIQVITNCFWWWKLGLKLLYAFSIINCCRRPQRWENNLFYFLLTSVAHYGYVQLLVVHPLGKYKVGDRFHDSQCLNELKYFREFVPLIRHRVIVLFKDVESQVEQPLHHLKWMNLVNFLVLSYNYLVGITHWYSFSPLLSPV